MAATRASLATAASRRSSTTTCLIFSRTTFTVASISLLLLWSVNFALCPTLYSVFNTPWCDACIISTCAIRAAFMTAHFCMLVLRGVCLITLRFPIFECTSLILFHFEFSLSCQLFVYVIIFARFLLFCAYDDGLLNDRLEWLINMWKNPLLIGISFLNISSRSITNPTILGDCCTLLSTGTRQCILNCSSFSHLILFIF